MRFTIYQSCYGFVCIYHIIIAICLRCFHIPNIHIQRKVKPLFQRPIRTTANQNLYATPQKCFILAVLSDELACCHLSCDKKTSYTSLSITYMLVAELELSYSSMTACRLARCLRISWLSSSLIERASSSARQRRCRSRIIP